MCEFIGKYLNIKRGIFYFVVLGREEAMAATVEAKMEVPMEATVEAKMEVAMEAMVEDKMEVMAEVATQRQENYFINKLLVHK
jgi:hypothetical protein